MTQEIVRNPSELPAKGINSNPNNKTITTMANRTDKAVDALTQQAKTAAYILGGQAVASQANAIVVPNVLENQSATVQQIARAGIPLTLGVLLAISTKNEILRGLSLGFGTQGVLEAIKFVMPNFSPATGQLGEGSSFTYTDENGDTRQAIIMEGQVITDKGETAPLALPEAAQMRQAADGRRQTAPAGNNAETVYI